MKNYDITYIFWFTYISVYSEKGVFRIKYTDFLKWLKVRDLIIDYTVVNPSPGERLQSVGKVLTLQNEWITWHDFFDKLTEEKESLFIQYLNIKTFQANIKGDIKTGKKKLIDFKKLKKQP